MYLLKFTQEHGWFLLVWNYVSWVAKSHCPYTSPEKGASGTPVEPKVGPVTTFSVLWWSWVPRSMKLKSISLLCVPYMARSHVVRIRACKPLKPGVRGEELGAGSFVLELKYPIFLFLHWPHLFWPVTCSQV